MSAGLRGKRDQFRAPTRQFTPAIIEFDVVTNLDAEFPEVAFEDGDLASGNAAIFEIAPIRRNHQLNFAIDARDLALAPKQNCGVRYRPVGFLEIRGGYDVTAVVTGFSTEPVAEFAPKVDRS